MSEFNVSIVISSLDRSRQLKGLLALINDLVLEVPYRFTCYVCEQGEKLSVDVREFSNLRLNFLSTSSRGISLGRNTCLDALAIDEDIVLFLDDDASIDEVFFRRLYFCWQKYPNAGAISGRIIDPSTGEEISRYMRRAEGKLKLVELDVIMSSCLTVDANLIRRHGLRFDQRFGVGAFYGGSEESEFVYQIFVRGESVYYDTQLTVFHPKYRHENFSIDEVRERAFSYGLGRGALLKKMLGCKVNSEALRFLLLNFSRPMLGLMYHVFRLNKSGMVFYWFTLKGRFSGFLGFEI